MKAIKKPQKKLVRIDSKTVVEADINIPDSLVIKKFKENRLRNEEKLKFPLKRSIDFFR